MNMLLRALDRVSVWATVFSTWAAGLALVTVCLLILLEILLRNAFNLSTGISVEYSSYLLVFMVFMALQPAQKSGSMIYVEILYDRISPKRRNYANALRYTLALVYGLIAIWFTTKYTMRTCSLNQLSMFPSRTPLCIPQAVMIVGLALLLIEYLRGTVTAWYYALKGERSYIDETRPLEKRS